MTAIVDRVSFIDFSLGFGIGSYGYNLAITIYIIGVLAFIFQTFLLDNKGKNLIMIIISLELILLSIGILLINLTVGLDDLVGSNMTLFLLPLAGAESAVALALLIAFYPIRGTVAL